MADRLLIWGAGGHARVVADVARAAGYRLCGFVDQDAARIGESVPGSGCSVVLSEEALESQLRAGRCSNDIDCITLAVGDNARRLELLSLLTGIPSPPLIHPSCVVSPSAAIGRASVVFPLAVINANAHLGEAVIVNSAAVVEHDCQLGDGSHISPGAVLAGGVHVGARSWVGAGATVIQGVRIGRDAVIGAGSVVIRDVPDGMKVVGVPARTLVAANGASRV
jgi:sugar O-acyltransferase (sialic acid O-acetyltransferase NeuD family)